MADGRHLKLLRKLKPPKPAFGGWVRTEIDGVIRGWAVNGDDPGARLRIEVRVDNEPLATVTADRYDAKVEALGHGDGRYAFEVMTPPALRDGAPHRFEARVLDGPGYVLKVKQDVFTFSPSLQPPEINVFEASWTGSRGEVRGRFHSPPRLELWADGNRASEPLDVVWDLKKDRAFFSLRLDPRRMAEIEGGALEFVAPGMAEAGLKGGRFALPSALRARRVGDGRVVVDMPGGGPLYGALQCRIRIGGGDPIFTSPVRFERQRAVLALPEEVAVDGADVRIAIDGFEPERLRARIEPAPPSVTRNADLRHWEHGGPAHWRLGPTARAEPGFHRAPALLRLGAEGHFARIEVAGTGGAERLLSQAVRPSGGAQADELALLARSSEPAVCRLRVLDRSGSQAASLNVRLPGGWTWVYSEALAALGPQMTEGVVDLEATAESGGPGPLVVDVAGLRLGVSGLRVAGAPMFGEAELTKAARAAPGRELVLNGDLSRWPGGLRFRAAGERLETAAGWHVLSREVAAPLHALALTSETDTALAVAGEGFGRIEVRLDEDGVSALKYGRVRFTAFTPDAARRLLAQSAAAAPRHTVIDRVRVIRRSAGRSSAGESRVVDHVVATVAGRLLLTRDPHEFEFEVRPPTAAVVDLTEPERAQSGEYYLAFEFRSAFAAALSKVSLMSGALRSSAPPPTFLQLEDRNIAAQAGEVRGLEAWVAPAVVATPATDAPARATMNWSWSRADLGSVEVVVCVHNAPEQTLACLRSLSTSTEVPHTVHVIDDGSEPDTAERVRAFVAERPWMRLTRHEANLGYTASADEGVRAATSEWVALLNSDLVLTRGWLEGLLDASTSAPDVAFVGPVSNAASYQSVPDIHGPDGRFAVNALPAGWDAEDMAAAVRRASQHAFPQVPLLNGFCTLMRRSVVLELGGFNVTAFPAGYGEENDLCARATKAGHKLVVADHVYVHHVKSASFGSERRDELAKAGSRALKALHPDVDFGALTASFRDSPPLVHLRDAVRREISGAVSRGAVS